jgi:hypothetical protein
MLLSLLLLRKQSARGLTFERQMGAVAILSTGVSGPAAPHGSPDTSAATTIQISFVEGRNIAIEYRWAEGHYDRLPQQAAELVARGVAVSLRKIPPC